MIKHLLFACIGALSLQFSFAQNTAAVSGILPDSCHPVTFLKFLGEPGKIENHSALRAAPDGNLYLAGLKGARTAISKMAPDGKFLWTRSFVTEPYEPVIVAEIIVDSEGMIVGSGRKGDKSVGKGFAFRYDPIANEVLWAHQFVSNFPVQEGGILEKTPGGNFLLYQNPQVDSFTTNSEILELDRATGQMVPAFANRYRLLNLDQSFRSVVAHDNHLYIFGSCIGFGSRRVLLARLDAATGAVQRGEAAHQGWLTPGYFSGSDLIVEDSSLVFLYHGSETSFTINDGSGMPVPLFLQKNAISGEVLWIRKYMVSTPPKEVVAVPDGYIILGGRTDHYLLKTDKDGNLLTTMRLDNPPAFSNNNGEQQNQMALVGNHLFVADVALTTSADQYTTLLKADLNLGIEFDCSNYRPLQTSDSATVDHMTNYPMTAYASTTMQQAVAVSLAADAVTIRETCPACLNPPDPCQPNTFIKVYGEVIKQNNIAALRAAPDGNIYVAGGKADGYAIGKMTPEGDMIWLSNFTGTAQDRTFVTEIIVDSEGMIVGSGFTNSQTGNETMAFRYNPVTNQILWERRLGISNSTDIGILEKKPGGNFLIFHSPRTSPLGYKSGELLELNRMTGQVVPAFGKRYAQQINQIFAGMVLHGDALYATGHTDSLLPFNQSARRMILTKLDANTGNVLWSRLGLTPWSQTSHFRGADLIIDDNSLIVLSHGIETSNTITGPGKVIPVYLHKTTLDGELLWAKKYLLTEVPREVVAVPDGYVIYCGNTKRHLLKTDKDGNLLFAKALNTPDYFTAGYDDWQKNQVERVGSYLYTTDFTAKGGIAGHFTTILKTDVNLGMEFDCGLEFLTVADTTMTNPMLFASTQTVTISPATSQSVTLTNSPGTITVNSVCPFCPNPPCLDKPDITFQIENVGCDSTAFVTYRLCNTGKQPFAGTLQVGVYDSNPMTGAATLLDLFFLQNLTLPADSCRTGTLKNLTYWGNYSKVYTLAGIESGQTTPVDPAGFPYNGIAECDYANNIDSLNFQYPPAPPFDLGPNTDICPGDSLLLGAGLNGFVSYTWQDGSHGSTFWVKGEGFFTLNTVDGCGRTASDNISIGLKKLPKATREIVLLPGDSVVIDGKKYTATGTVISYEPSTTGGCDTLVSNNIRLDSLHCTRPGAFFKTYKGVSGRVIVPAVDGGYYVGGATVQEHALAKFDATGKNLWVRQFDFFDDHFIQTLIEDSEGKLVGSATSEGGTPSILAFRYDPATDQMLWIRRFLTSQVDIRGHEIVEKSPGGDFLLSYQFQVTSTDFHTEMVTLNRATGAMVSNWRYDSRAALNSIEVHKGFLYASGMLEDTTTSNLAWRGGLVKIDLGTGVPVWSHLIKASDANLFGGNLLVDGNGNAVSTMVLDTRTTVLQMTAPDGNLVWMKKIRFDDPNEHHFYPLGIALVKDGYLIGMQTYSDSSFLHSYIVVKTDLNGVLLWSKKVPHVGNSFVLSPHHLAARGYEGCFVTNTFAAVFQNIGMVLAKFDRQGRLGEGCPVALETPVTISAHTGSMQPAKVVFTTFPRVFEPVTTTASAPISVLQNTACSRCLPPCQPIAVQEVIEFYPGDTITIGSTDYTQSDTAVQILCTEDGCDSVVTYILRLVITNLDLVCPSDMTVTIPANQSSTPVTYPLPAAATDCPDTGIVLKRLQGPPSGGQFPVGSTLVCHEATNQCGIRDTCCFTVIVQKAAVVDETACDVKTPPGSCIKYELLGIRLDSLGRPRYRFRLTNTCASPLRYAYFQLPNSMTAKAPLEGATYTAPSGNTYLVRNPNAAPFRSVRFKPLSGNLNNGKSDIFEYTLPKQAQMAFILASVKLEDGSSSEAHLNTFACPVQPYVASAQEPVASAQNRSGQTASSVLLLRPNPTNGLLFLDLQTAEPVLISVLNAQGQLVLEGRFVAENNRISLRLPDGLANGLYYLTAQPVVGGVRSAARFVLER